MKFLLVLSLFLFAGFMEARFLSLFDREANNVLQKSDFLAVGKALNKTATSEGSAEKVGNLKGEEANEEVEEVDEEDDTSAEEDCIEEDCDCSEIDDQYGNGTSLNETSRAKRCGCWDYGCGCATPATKKKSIKKKEGKV